MQKIVFYPVLSYYKKINTPFSLAPDLPLYLRYHPKTLRLRFLPVDTLSTHIGMAHLAFSCI